MYSRNLSYSFQRVAIQLLLHQLPDIVDDFDRRTSFPPRARPSLPVGAETEARAGRWLAAIENFRRNMAASGNKRLDPLSHVTDYYNNDAIDHEEECKELRNQEK